MNEPVEIAINCDGEVTGEKYKGVFKIRPRLSHRDTLLRDQFRRELLGQGGDAADANAQNIAEVFSKIWAHTIEAPIYWKDSNRGLDLLDEAPVVAIYKAIVEKEKEFVDALKKAGEEAAKDLKPSKSK